MKTRCVYCAKMLRRKSQAQRVPYRLTVWSEPHKCCLNETACATRQARKVNQVKRNTLVNLGFMSRAVR
jgi:hypothetical protein